MLLGKQTVTVIALAVGVAACSDSTTGPDEDFNLQESAQELQTVENAFDTEVFNSLERLGGRFGVPGMQPLVDASVSSLMIAAGDVPRREMLARRLSSYLESSSASVVILIPDQYRGLTLVYDPATDAYVVDSNLVGPVNGIRFLIYAVNPITGDPVVPLNEVGHVDILDESTGTSAIARLIVVSGTTEFINYTVTLSGTPLTPSFRIQGFVSDGANRVEFDLTTSIAANIGGVTVALDYSIAVPASGFSVAATLEIVDDVQTEGESVTVNVQFAQGQNSVVFDGAIDNDVGELTVTVNTQPFAVISINGEVVTVTDPDGNPLTEAEEQALRDMVDAFEKVFGTWEHLFAPVEFLFGGPGG